MLLQRTETTLEEVKAAGTECQKRHDTLRGLQQQRRRIELQISTVQQAVYSANQERECNKRALAAVLGGEAEGNLGEMKTLKASLDDAECRLMERRDERAIVREAEKVIATKVVEADKSYIESIKSVHDLARKFFKSSFSRSRMWANSAEREYDWRAGLLETILCRLAVGELRMNLLILETFLVGGKVKVKVQRSFWYGKTSDDRRALQPEEEITIPTNLDYRMAFDELMAGRLALVGA